MKLFLFQWPLDNDAYRDVLLLLEQAGHEITYLAGSGSQREVAKRFPRAILHEHERAFNGEPANGASEFLVPPSASLIRAMSEVELLVLSMMNKHFDWMTIDERKQVYYNILGYWHAVLSHEKPGALIFTAVPHSVYDYVAYELAQRLGIRTIMFDNTTIDDRYLYLTDFRKGSEAVRSALFRLANARVTPADLALDIRTYYERSRDSSIRYVPPYVVEDSEKYSFINVLKLRRNLVSRSIKDGSFLRKIFFFLVKAFGAHIKKEYQSVAQPPDLSQPFVYVPLGYQPECTTSPQGDIFVVQTLMLETLSAALPKGWRIYVKEHPSQWGPKGLNFSSSRYQGYYRRLARIPGVMVVPVTTQSSDLIRDSKAIVTVSGTAGFEALLRQKPVIIFGHPWYQDAPALLRADSIPTCRQCFEKIIRGMEILEEENLRFLKALEEGTVHGHFQAYSKRHSQVTSQESAKAIGKIILEALTATL